MDDSLNICLACGLCCDGTLIGFVQLEQEEVPALKKIMDVEDENGQGFFLHPCNSFCNSCTIYEDRPKQCAKFKCGLLKSVEQEEMEFNSAIELVAEVKQQKVAIEAKISALQIELKSPSFYFKMVELKNQILNKKTEFKSTASHLELISDVEKLDDMLSESFDVRLK